MFGDPVPSALNASLPDASRKMLAMRIGERVNIMVETGRIEGVEAPAYQGGMLLANCIQLGAFNLPWQYEEEMLAFYTQARMPMTRTMPGCIRARTLASVAGWAKLGVIYEFPSLQARDEVYEGHESQADAKAWSERMVPRMAHAPGSANVALRIWPPAA